MRRHSIPLLVVALRAGCGGGGGSGGNHTNSASQADAVATDAAAKSDARNLEAQMEACFVDNQNYAKCRRPLDAAASGLKFGSGPGQVEVTKADAQSYTAVSHSKSGATFTLTKDASGKYTIPQLPPDPCTVNVTRSWFKPFEGSATIAAAGPTTFDVTFAQVPMKVDPAPPTRIVSSKSDSRAMAATPARCATD